jgi:hypothetical protein
LKPSERSATLLSIVVPNFDLKHLEDNSLIPKLTRIV